MEILQPQDFDKMYRLMEESFPQNEYLPYKYQKARLREEDYVVYTLPDPETADIQAFLAVWNFQKLTFVEHFAVNPAYRNGGIGGRFLRELVESRPQMVSLEVELPETEMAKRRIRFYERNGFHYNDYPYYQPPFRKEDEPLPLRIMTTERSLEEEEFLRMKDFLYAHIYPGLAGGAL